MQILRVHFMYMCMITLYRLMWLAGLFASLASIIYPSISALVSKNASSEQQGVALGILTGMRGLCNGLGPALFGLLFWLFNVSLSEVSGKEAAPDILAPAAAAAAHTIKGKGNFSVQSVHVSWTCLPLRREHGSHFW